ncbi:hypothetical protein HZA86_04520 [Candidatus Uhrbacteria bacterium]|nr:hypothetical protein [Candidatus Uhrbacteria bacterium]
MTQERWDQLVEQLRKQGWIEQEDSQQTDQTTTQTVITATPAGKMKLVFVIKPKFLGAHTTYNRRAGAPVIVEPTYSADETVTVFELYRWAGDDWQRLDDAALGALQTH